MKRLSRVLLAVGLSLLFVNVMWGQFTIQVIATDGVNTDTLVLGTAVGATSSIDAGQGEVELPPVPPSGIFDARFAAFGSVTLGQGTAKDIRGYVSTKQNGTYKIKWQDATENTHGDSIVFSWPAGLSSVAGGYWHMTGLSGLDIDMAASTSGKVSSDDGTVTISTGDATSFTTFTYQRFQSDMNVKLKLAGQARDKSKPFQWPNVHNVGEEISGSKTFVAPMSINGLGVQTVTLKKYADVLKAFNVKGATHSKDSINCLDYYPHTAKGKSWPGQTGGDPTKAGKTVKGLTTLSPVAGKGINSYLFAQLATLKFNLKASGLKTPAGLGALTINDGTRFAGLTINGLALAGDSALACAGTSVTRKEVCDELEKVNKAFNKSALNGDVGDIAHCDTLPGVLWWHGMVGGKQVAGTKLTLQLAGWVPLAKVSWISGGGSSSAVNEHNSIVENVQPENYSLEQNYPNPFNPSTKIQFNLANDGMVSVKIFNMLGQEVSTLANQEMTAGVNTVTFDASSMASGVYFYRVSVNDLATGKLMFSDMKKMMLVK